MACSLLFALLISGAASASVVRKVVVTDTADTGAYAPGYYHINVPIQGSSMGGGGGATKNTKDYGYVQCALTIDNVLTQVTYNGTNVISHGPSADWNDWKKMKLVSFKEVSGGVLAISGHHSDATTGSGTCANAGLLVTCIAQINTSIWNHWAANSTNMLSYGGSAASKALAGWHEQEFNTSSHFVAPCNSTSTFSLNSPHGAATSTKIWGSDKYSWFRSKQR